MNGTPMVRQYDTDNHWGVFLGQGGALGHNERACRLLFTDNKPFRLIYNLSSCLGSGVS